MIGGRRSPGVQGGLLIYDRIAQDSTGMNARSSSFATRRIARGAIIGVAAIGIVGLAAVGAVIALGVLAVGAIAHGTLRLVRGVRPRPAHGDGVIDGEFRVIREPGRDAAGNLRRLPQV